MISFRGVYRSFVLRGGDVISFRGVYRSFVLRGGDVFHSSAGDDVTFFNR